MAGFDHARGRVVVSLDGDLQNDPRDIPTLIAKLEEQGVTVSEVDKQAFIALASPLHEEYAARLGMSDMLETVRNLR
jgi:TRAP-type C4-dicarboxylate transport system substrate-binding protein